MKNKIIILHIVNLFYSGGIREFIMNYYRNINRDKYEFCFLVQRRNEIPEDEEIKRLGGKIYYGPSMYKNEANYCKFLYHFLKVHQEIDIVHSHLNLRNLLPMYVAKKAKIKMRISHCHKNENNETGIQRLKRRSICLCIKKLVTHKCACSPLSARYMYNNDENVVIINNAIDIGKFEFNVESRNEIRKIYGVNEKFVIGHVGNFSAEKNQLFLIECFNIVLKYLENAVLILVGEGEYFESAKRKAKQLRIEQNVIFTGTRKDAYKFYSAFDEFVFPSKSEGFGMSILEAECSGVPVLVSQDIHSNACLEGMVEMLPLSVGVNIWADKMIQMSKMTRNQNSAQRIKESSYEIKFNATKLESLYSKGVLKE